MSEQSEHQGQAERFWLACHGIVAQTCASLAQAWLRPGGAAPADEQRQRIASLLWVLDRTIEARSAGPLVEYAARLGHDCARAGRGLDEPMAALATVTGQLREQLAVSAGIPADGGGSPPLFRLLQAASRAMTEGYVAAVCEGHLERTGQRRSAG